MLYLGTDNALYVSWDDGGRWTRLRGNLPPAPIYWMEVQPRFHDLVIASYGRGFWILDDLTALRGWEQGQGADAYLFPPRPAYRYRTKQDLRARDANSAVVGENPPYGAAITFRLGKAPRQLEIAVLGPGGEVVRTMKQAEPSRPGEAEDEAEKA